MAGAAAPFAYLGTSGFATVVLDGLVAGNLAPALVVTPPDRPKGRGRRMQPPPVAARAIELELPLHQSADVNSDASRAALAAAGPALGVVCAFGQLLRAPLLDELEMLNVHPSLLPRWRGAAPIERTIMAGDERTGVAIMRLVEALDAGPVALMQEVEIASDEDFGSLERRLAELGGELLVTALRAHAAGTLGFTPQDESAATYAEKIEGADRRLDPARSALELERVVRALTPHVGAYLELEGGERLGVVRAGAATAPGGEPPGCFVTTEGELSLVCAEGALAIEQVRPAGKRAMPVADYLRGHELPRLAR